jgi:hypothetical protein
MSALRAVAIFLGALAGIMGASALLVAPLFVFVSFMSPDAAVLSYFGLLAAFAAAEWTWIATRR